MCSDHCSSTALKSKSILHVIVYTAAAAYDPGSLRPALMLRKGATAMASSTTTIAIVTADDP